MAHGFSFNWLKLTSMVVWPSHMAEDTSRYNDLNAILYEMDNIKPYFQIARFYVVWNGMECYIITSGYAFSDYVTFLVFVEPRI